MDNDERDRPSQHGAILGKALIALAEAGREHSPPLPEPCATCAFKEGCMTNQMAGTGIAALNCVLGVDTDRFACHHGMQDGHQVKLCAGYIAAILAPWEFTTQIMQALAEELSKPREGPDAIREEFDAWISMVDPTGQMDDYARGRAWLRKKLKEKQHEQAG